METAICLPGYGPGGSQFDSRIETAIVVAGLNLNPTIHYYSQDKDVDGEFRGKRVREALMKGGIPEYSIRIEPKAPSTIAEIYHTIHAQPRAEEYIIVTQLYHARRGLLMLRRELKRAKREDAKAGYFIARGGTVADYAREVRSMYRFYYHSLFGDEPHLDLVNE